MARVSLATMIAMTLAVVVLVWRAVVVASMPEGSVSAACNGGDGGGQPPAAAEDAYFSSRDVFGLPAWDCTVPHWVSKSIGIVLALLDAFTVAPGLFLVPSLYLTRELIQWTIDSARYEWMLYERLARMCAGATRALSVRSRRLRDFALTPDELSARVLLSATYIKRWGSAVGPLIALITALTYLFLVIIVVIIRPALKAEGGDANEEFATVIDSNPMYLAVVLFGQFGFCLSVLYIPALAGSSFSELCNDLALSKSMGCGAHTEELASLPDPSGVDGSFEIVGITLTPVRAIRTVLITWVTIALILLGLN
jgi:hypothetical protein